LTDDTVVAPREDHAAPGPDRFRPILEM